MGHEINRGQIVVGRKALSESTGISEQSIRTSLEHLKSTSEITSKSTNKFTIITLCNYEIYQGDENEINQQNPSKLTNDQPTTNQQLTTSKEGIECKNEKNNIKTWRNDYQTYHDQCNAAFDKLLEDWNWIRERKEYHPGLKIRKSTEKMFWDYWGTEQGWRKKKAAKTAQIDWKATVNNGLTLKCNQVWLQKGERDDEMDFIETMERRAKNADAQRDGE